MAFFQAIEFITEAIYLGMDIKDGLDMALEERKNVYTIFVYGTPNYYWDSDTGTQIRYHDGLGKGGYVYELGIPPEHAVIEHTDLVTKVADGKEGYYYLSDDGMMHVRADGWMRDLTTGELTGPGNTPYDFEYMKKRAQSLIDAHNEAIPDAFFDQTNNIGPIEDEKEIQENATSSSPSNVVFDSNKLKYFRYRFCPCNINK